MKVTNYPKFVNKTRENINIYEAASGFRIKQETVQQITDLEKYLADNMLITAPGIIADEISQKTAKIKVEIEQWHKNKIETTQNEIVVAQENVDKATLPNEKRAAQDQLDKLNAELKKLSEVFTTLEKSFATDLGTAHQAAANHQAWINGIASLRADEDYRKKLDTTLGIKTSNEITIGSPLSDSEMNFRAIRERYDNPMGGQTTLTWDKTGMLTDFTINAPSPFTTKNEAIDLSNMIDNYISNLSGDEVWPGFMENPVKTVALALKTPLPIIESFLKISTQAISTAAVPSTTGTMLKGLSSFIDDIRGVSAHQRKCFEHETCALTGVMLRQGQEKISFTIASDKQYLMDDRARSQILGAIKAGADLDKITIKTANPEYGKKEGAPEYLTKNAADYFRTPQMKELLQRRNDQAQIIREQIKALRTPQTEGAKATLEKLKQEKLNPDKLKQEKSNPEKESSTAGPGNKT